jgi:hypothetical protein
VPLARNTAADSHGRPWSSVVRACTVTSPDAGKPVTLTWTGATAVAVAGPASRRTAALEDPPALKDPLLHPAAASASTAHAARQPYRCDLRMTITPPSA